MKSASLVSAYQLQRKYLLDRRISGYKVGASNYTSAEFFGVEDIIVGGIDDANLYFASTTKEYEIAELELIVRVEAGSEETADFRILSQHIGLECPKIEVDNPHGDPFLCIADNCSAGDLVVIQDYNGTYTEVLGVYVNGAKIATGRFSNLRLPVNDILEDAMRVIEQNKLPHEATMYIATGGLTSTFSLREGDLVEIHFE